MKTLAQLVGEEAGLEGEAAMLEITGISADSRHVVPGYLFAALPGSKVDGAKFVSAALAQGAAAILTGHQSEIGDCPVPVVRVDDPRRALALAAARFFDRQPDIAVAVTGTSGKTSVADFTRQIFAKLGHRAASVGTIGVVRPDGSVYGGLTTPDPISLHATLAELTSEGVTHLAFEASSHGLDQRRLDGVRLTAGAFTNLGRDHLDYHSSVDDYLQAKLRLFRELLPDHASAIVNMDGAYAEQALASAKARGLNVVTVGERGETLKLLEVERQGFRQVMRVGSALGEHRVSLPLVGTFQVENVLTAAGLALAVEPLERVLSVLDDLQGVAGRLEIIGEANGALAVVDYAHKPDALEAALAALKPFVSGRLVCVFGCGGDRDRGKRPIMGRIATENADIVIVTDDNPRGEDPATIRAEILAAAPGAREIGDRGEAIYEAASQLLPGDVLLVAGKGHETGQIVGDEVLPFSDHQAVRTALATEGRHV